MHWNHGGKTLVQIEYSTTLRRKGKEAASAARYVRSAAAPALALASGLL